MDAQSQVKFDEMVEKRREDLLPGELVWLRARSGYLSETQKEKYFPEEKDAKVAVKSKK